MCAEIPIGNKKKIRLYDEKLAKTLRNYSNVLLYFTALRFLYSDCEITIDFYSDAFVR